MSRRDPNVLVHLEFSADRERWVALCSAADGETVVVELPEGYDPRSDLGLLASKFAFEAVFPGEELDIGGSHGAADPRSE